MSAIQPWELVAGNGCVADLDSIQRAPLTPTGSTEGRDRSRYVDLGTENSSFRLPQVQIFEHIDFGGHTAITSLNWYYVGDWWNDKISSLVVISGTWRFYEHWHYEGRYWDLSPGYYRWVVDAGIPNDIISSFQVIAR
jgi:Beta/Gamma crystallin